MPDLTQTGRVREYPLIRDLLALVDELGLDLGDMVIFGSGPLLAKGLRSDIRDLDVVARNETWRLVERHGVPSAGEVNGARMAQFRGGLIQFSSGWVSDEWKAAELIDRAEIIDGLPFARLVDVLAYKEQLNRPKDRWDICTLRKLGVARPVAAAPGRRATSGVLRRWPSAWSRGDQDPQRCGRFLTVAPTFPLLFLVGAEADCRSDDASLG